MEKTLVIIKPDAMNKKLEGKIIDVYLRNDLNIFDIRMVKASREILSKHYEEHIGKPFYEELIEFMSSEKIILMVLIGEEAVHKVREINGNTDPAKAGVNTMRYLYGSNIQNNAVHGSADLESAQREIEIWFGYR